MPTERSSPTPSRPTGSCDALSSRLTMSWQPHPLAGDRRPQLELKVKERCRAIVDLPGVPAGTQGRVLLANGFAWKRYTVAFENGEVLSALDGRHIESAKRRR